MSKGLLQGYKIKISQIIKNASKTTVPCRPFKDSSGGLLLTGASVVVVKERPCCNLMVNEKVMIIINSNILGVISVPPFLVCFKVPYPKLSSYENHSSFL